MGSFLANLPFAIEKLRSPWQEPSFLHALRAFLRAIRENKQPAAAGFDDGYASQMVIAAALESLENRRCATVQPLWGQSA
jgi:predicted dehydrogenase